MTDANVVSIDSMTVRYGRNVAVDDVSLDVPRGTVYALLGRNGAGKSSLVRCLVGQQKPAHGRAILFGEDVWTRRAQLMERVGIVPEEADAPPEMTVHELSKFCGEIYSRWDHNAVRDRLSRFAIKPDARFGTLSKGQKKQVMLAMALAVSPELLVLDDPTLGLDVVARKSLFDEVISDLADRGTTTVITTHDLAGVEALADRVAILKDGRLVLDEPMEALKSRFRRIRFPYAAVALAAGNLRTASVTQWGGGTEAIVSNYDDVVFERFRSAANVTHADVSPMSLEEIFIAVAGEEVRS
ncbi:MAG TPA: ABC transporter ATP-binding protein [Thermoanaerobaculia bacterium]|jgi:ABC-2 type transport system ATP-binding protein|nr:ABC transporter ATP-binding protein [Thermoanaerobaculia bacterium]